MSGRTRAAVAAAVAVLVLAGCSGSGSGGAAGSAGSAGGAASAGSGTAYVSGDGAVTRVPPGRRGAPVSLVGSTLEGIRLDVATLRGKPLVLNIWGSWCPPCRKEAADLQSAYQQLQTRASFVGINTKDSTAAALAFQRRFAIGYPSVVDTGGLLLQLRGAIGPVSYPTTLVLDGQGRIAARVSGPVTTGTVTGLVADVAAGR
jgi:thiol-disulfide isomerase/thioredoxin